MTCLFMTGPDLIARQASTPISLNILSIDATVLPYQAIDGHSALHGPVLGTGRWSLDGTARQVQRAVPCEPTGGTNGPSTALKAACRAVPARWPNWPSVPKADQACRFIVASAARRA